MSGARPCFVTSPMQRVLDMKRSADRSSSNLQVLEVKCGVIAKPNHPILMILINLDYLVSRWLQTCPGLNNPLSFRDI